MYIAIDSMVLFYADEIKSLRNWYLYLTSYRQGLITPLQYVEMLCNM